MLWAWAGIAIKLDGTEMHDKYAYRRCGGR